MQGGIVHDQGEMSAHQVVAQFLNGPLDGEGFSFLSGICLLSRGKLSADVEDQVLFTVEVLGWDGSSPISDASIWTTKKREKSGFLRMGDLGAGRIRACLRA